MSKTFDLKSLDRRDARLALAVERFCRQDLGLDLRGKSLLLAVSGGADSCAMLVLFRALQGYLGLALHVCHLDHALRPSSAAEADLVRQLCARLEIGLTVERQDVAKLAKERGWGLEQAGRVARYDFFERERLKLGADWILTAHHLGDLGEDVLLRLIRGAGWPGLGGMAAVRGNILRPLLLTPKQELQDLLQRQNLTWAEDESNSSLEFRRNRVRQQILPLILEENPAFADQIRNLWRGARQDEAYWRDMLTQICHCQDGQLCLKRTDLAELHPAARLKLYALCLKDLGQGQALFENLQVLDQVFITNQQKIVQFPGLVEAKTDRSGLTFQVRACGDSDA